MSGYLYDVTEVLEHGERAEILAYHWNPESTGGDPGWPHMHVYGNRQIHGRHLSKMHLPTGRVNLHDLIRLLIPEFSVVPRRDDWVEVLNAAEQALVQGN
jgi:hypothetical protein